MIEKLKRPVKIGGTTFREKINELVDAVNELQLAKDVMFKRIDILNNAICDIRNHIADTSKKMADRMIGCTTLDIPKSYKNDPYAEQRKWIGKLCWFWDAQEEYKFVGILGEVADNGTYFQKGGIVSYLNCEPVKPDDSIIYKGDK